MMKKLLLIFLAVLFVATPSFAKTLDKSEQEKKLNAAILMASILTSPQYTAEYCVPHLTKEKNQQFISLVRDWNVKYSAESIYAMTTIFSITGVRDLGTPLKKITLEVVNIQRKELNQTDKEYCQEQLIGLDEVKDMTLKEVFDSSPGEDSRKGMYEAYELLYGKKRK